MKSSAPQTTMSITLAPMIAQRPPEGAQTCRELYAQAGGRDGTGVGRKQFAVQLSKRAEVEKGFMKKAFTHNGQAGVMFYWMEVSK